MRIFLIDECVDRVGGVERVICTLANNLYTQYDTEVISELHLSDLPFYSYADGIKINYLLDERNSKSRKRTKKDNVYFFHRFFEKIKEKVVLRKEIEKIVKARFKNADVIVFGRVATALRFLPYIKKNQVHAKIVVRDAIHLEYYTEKEKKGLCEYFPDYVDHFIVSSDESISAYHNFFGDSDIKYEKIFNPLGIEPSGTYNYDKKTIISIGRMDEQKGYENLILSYKKVLKIHPDWKLNIYGNGNYEQKIIEFIKKNGLEGKIGLLPSTKNVVEAFNNSSIFVLPSRYEGYANILVEAMSCGMPVISYNWLMGVEEIIEDNKNGLIVPLKNRVEYFKGSIDEEDAENLANAIDSLIEHPELCQLFSENAKRIIDSRNIDTILGDWKRIILKEGEKHE